MDLFKLRIKKTEFSSKCLGDSFRLLIESYDSNLTFRKGPVDLFKLRIKKTRFSSKCLGDIFRLLIESYDSNLTFRKGPMDLFCFQDKFICLDKPIVVFGYN